MIWLTWRQFRLQFLAILTAVVVVSAALSITGPGLVDAFHADAGGFLRRLTTEQAGPALYLIGIASMYAVAPVIGAFWGAPLVARELEAGTYRLVWSQSITRNRWLAGKFGFLLVAAVTLTGALSLAVSWWARPIDTAISAGDKGGAFELPRMHPLIFAARGVVPIGYAALALALGVAVGLLLRRTVAAIALTLILVVAVQLVLPLLVREHLATPTRDVVTITDGNLNGLMLKGDPVGGTRTLTVTAGAPGDWITSSRLIGADGEPEASAPAWTEQCMGPIGASTFTQAEKDSQRACFARLSTEGLHQEVIHQPAGNFWTLQWRETALLLALAGLLGGLCFWRINRDLS